MKIETLKERIAKAEAKVTKKQGTIERKQKQMNKKVDTLKKKYNFTMEEEVKHTDELAEMGYNKEDAWEMYWLQCEVSDLESDLERLPKEIVEIERTIEKYKLQLSGELEKESTFIKEVPEILKQMEKQLVEEWDRWDKERKERLCKVYKEVGYTAFFKGTEEKHYFDKHTYADYEFMNKDDNSIHEDNCKFARAEVIDMYIRVKNITGEITDWKGIVCEQGNVFPVLTGTVVGKEGMAKIETILAGGYNIQRLHIRTLVHSI